MGDANRTRTPAELAVLERLHQLCARLPGVTEARDGFGHTTLRVGKKSLAILGDDSGAPSLALKTDPHTQAALIKNGRFVRTPYIGQHGWVSIRGASQSLDWETIDELLEDAYRAAAPKKLLEKLDG